MKNWFLKYEQLIWFFSLVIYMVTLMFVFDYELKNTNWASIVWIIQFFGLTTLLSLRGIKKGWSWPSRP
jgi:ABC-type transport system involved in cytochrome c biogenesis permease component